MNLDTLAVSANVLPDSCTGYILITSTEYTALKSPFTEFDLTVFSYVTGFLLTIFVSGFVAGLIVRRMKI